MEIEVGRVYRAKKPREVVGLVNDRAVLWINGLRSVVQYDGPAVANGRHYPKVSMEAFLAWAGEDITGKLPEGRWADWPIVKGETTEEADRG